MAARVQQIRKRKGRRGGAKQKITAAFWASLAFVGGVTGALGGTVGRAVFVLSFLLLLACFRRGVSVREAVFLSLVFSLGYVRAHTSALAVALPHSLTEFLGSIHHGLAIPFTRLFSPDEASLATGLTIGADVAFSSSLRAAMRASGTTHLVALSGYNVSIVVTNTLALLTRLMHRRAAAWIAGIGIVGFTLTAGSQPSLVRAACMGVFALAAYQLGRRYRTAHALAYAGAAMLVFDPTLITSLGAVLSFLSLLGVAYIGPVLPFPRLGKGKVGEMLLEQVQTTVAAQLAVLPVILAMFGKANVLSIVANTAILPFVPFTMLVAMATSFVGVFMPTLVFVPAFLLHLLLTYILTVVHLFSGIVIPITWQMSALEAVLSSGLIAVVTWYAHYSRRQTDRR